MKCSFLNTKRDVIWQAGWQFLIVADTELDKIELELILYHMDLALERLGRRFKPVTVDKESFAQII